MSIQWYSLGRCAIWGAFCYPSLMSLGAHCEMDQLASACIYRSSPPQSHQRLHWRLHGHLILLPVWLNTLMHVFKKYHLSFYTQPWIRRDLFMFHRSIFTASNVLLESPLCSSVSESLETLSSFSPACSQPLDHFR